jgi:hypothetical protein
MTLGAGAASSGTGGGSTFGGDKACVGAASTTISIGVESYGAGEGFGQASTAINPAAWRLSERATAAVQICAPA